MILVCFFFLFRLCAFQGRKKKTRKLWWWRRSRWGADWRARRTVWRGKTTRREGKTLASETATPAEIKVCHQFLNSIDFFLFYCVLLLSVSIAVCFHFFRFLLCFCLSVFALFAYQRRVHIPLWGLSCKADCSIGIYQKSVCTMRCVTWSL